MQKMGSKAEVWKLGQVKNILIKYGNKKGENMNLNKEKLKSLWDRHNKTNVGITSEIAERFDRLDQLFETILKDENKISYDDNAVKICGNLLNDTEGKSPTIGCFGPAVDEMTRPEAFSGIENIAKNFEDYKDLMIEIGSMLGGFDFENTKMIDKYRIISNTKTGIDDYNGTLTSRGMCRHASSNFADNTYFFVIMYFIQNKDTKKILDDSNIVLRYPINNKGKGYFCSKKVQLDDSDSLDKEQAKQKEALECRFPLKFLWMWANKDEVIHPIGLMAFRNFLNTEYGKEVLKAIDENHTPKNITNKKFDEFKTAWIKISDKILDDLDISKNTDVEEKTKAIENISKLISQVCIEETDIKNISDLLTTGNQAVILWGPPGTGKTYESETVVKELLQVADKEDMEEKYRFSRQENFKNNKGYYEIVQFHPNYTYQDFIGGISPSLDDKNDDISYVLAEGVFKRFCDEANKEANKDKKFIFIIDEINRAELSAVFGELLYALEYRRKSINLPHFGNFTIPHNIFIIGTMNNVDKSLVTFDLALRRRFGFFKLMPKLGVIKDVLSEYTEEESLENYYGKCKKLNKNIITQLELGKDYQIGQAYFLKLKDFLDRKKIEDQELQAITSFELEKLWTYYIEPLLEEYLGMSMEDDGIQDKLKHLKDEFLK